MGSAGAIQVTEGRIDVRQAKSLGEHVTGASLATLFETFIFHREISLFFRVKIRISQKNRVDKLALQRKENNSLFERKPQYTCVVEN